MKKTSKRFLVVRISRYFVVPGLGDDFLIFLKKVSYEPGSKAYNEKRLYQTVDLSQLCQ